MAEKKIPYRFTIGFNPGDPAHRQAAEQLNQQGRRKAQFLVNAILHYIHCPETPDLPELHVKPDAMGQKDMENLVIRILEVPPICQLCQYVQNALNRISVWY